MRSITILLKISILVAMVATAIFPAINAGPNNIPVGTKLRYMVVLKSGQMAPPEVFSANIYSQMFDSIGLRPGKIVFEIDFAPKHVEGYTIKGSEIIRSGQGGVFWICASADNIFLELQILEEKNNYVVVNYTLTFINFTLITLRKFYIQYPIIKNLFGEPYKSWEESVAWVYKKYSLTRTLSVREDNNEAVDLETKTGLGEWMVWLNPEDRISDNSLILGFINYAIPYFYENGVGFTSTLIFLNMSKINNADYTLALNGKTITIDREDIVTGSSIPFNVIGMNSTNAPLPKYRKILSSFGCSITKKDNKYVLSCNKLLQVYEKAKNHKPWTINIVERETNGISRKFLELTYRDMRLAPFPTEVYKSVYWRNTGILLSIEEDISIFGKIHGFFPPPISSYIQLNDTAIILVSMKAPIALKLTSIDTPNQEALLQTSQRKSESYLPLAGLIIAILFPTLIILKKAIKH